jgi:hypothetical protein
VQAAFSAGVQVFEQPDLAELDLSLQQAFAELVFLSEQQALAAGLALSVLTFSVEAFSLLVTFCAETVVTVKAKTKVIRETSIANFFIFNCF